MATVVAQLDHAGLSVVPGKPAYQCRDRVAAGQRRVAAAPPLIRVLFRAVLIVLLIACANLAGLLLVHATRLGGEPAVRLALGSSSKTLVQQAAIERSPPQCHRWRRWYRVCCDRDPRFHQLLAGKSLPASTTFISTGLSLRSPCCSLSEPASSAALAPAFAALHTNMNEALEEGGRNGYVGGGHARLRSVLVVSEIAVALVLLILLRPAAT